MKARIPTHSRTHAVRRGSLTLWFTEEALAAFDAEIASLTAVGACDGKIVYNAVANRHPDAGVIIPPRATAVPN